MRSAGNAPRPGATSDSCLAAMSGVTKVFGTAGRETAALRDASLEVSRGELVLLLGPSGSGKTTLLTILAGLQPPTQGSVRVFGRDVADYSARELQYLRAVRIGFIFQAFHLLESLTVLENLLLVTKFDGAASRNARRRAVELLERFGVAHLVDAYPRTMSQGEKQRVAVARALINGAELIIGDEPTGSLASGQGLGIVSFLLGVVKTENRCVVIASHDERIARYATRVFRLDDGVLRPAALDSGPTTDAWK